MTRKHARSPAEGPGPAPQQIPHRSGYVSGSGDTDREGALWAPANGPTRSDPGGAGGEPDGHTVPVKGRNPLG